MNHPHSIVSNESGQVGNEAALSFLTMWMGVLDKRCFLLYLIFKLPCSNITI